MLDILFCQITMFIKVCVAFFWASDPLLIYQSKGLKPKTRSTRTFMNIVIQWKSIFKLCLSNLRIAIITSILRNFYIPVAIIRIGCSTKSKFKTCSCRVCCTKFDVNWKWNSFNCSSSYLNSCWGRLRRPSTRKRPMGSRLLNH